MGGVPYGPALELLQALVDESEVLILFNAKFDMHWLRKYGISFKNKKIRDVQYLFYLLKSQSVVMPSLKLVLETLDLPGKDHIKEKYWDKGILTSEIPLKELIKK